MKAVVEAPGQFEDFLPNGGGADLFAKVDALAGLLETAQLDYIEGLGLEVLGPIGPRTLIREPDGESHEVIMLGSNSYLSLTTHPRVVAAAKAACDTHGYGMGAVSLYSGTTNLHRELERRIAEFYGAEDAIIIPCGYSANVGSGLRVRYQTCVPTAGSRGIVSTNSESRWQSPEEDGNPIGVGRGGQVRPQSRHRQMQRVVTTL